jgi:retron-type reverse transcriptase
LQLRLPSGSGDTTGGSTSIFLLPIPTDWVLKADIAQFFDNLCHALLLTNLEQLQLEPTLLQLIEQQLNSGIVIGGQRSYPHKGVLQGGVLSGALANLYLTEFDRLCLRHGINLVRYGDDFVVVAADWIQANRALEQLPLG